MFLEITTTLTSATRCRRKKHEKRHETIIQYIRHDLSTTPQLNLKKF